MRVLETGHQQSFPLKAILELGVGGNMVMHDLDHHLPAKIGLLGQIHPPHAAFAQEFNGFIPAQKDSTQHRISIQGICGFIEV